MIGDEPEMDLPEGWIAEKLKFSGNFKLIATFIHEKSGAEIRISPTKTFSEPGFCNAHRLILTDPDGEFREVACGMEIEHVEEAKDAAVEAMNQVSSR